MNYLIYIFLGILQGLTEPLPISSSGHLYLIKQLLLKKILKKTILNVHLQLKTVLQQLVLHLQEL